VAAEEEEAAAVQDLAEPVDPEVEVAPVGAEAPAPVEVYGKRERPRVEVAVEAEELAQVVEDQEAEAEKVAVAKAPAMGVLAEALVEVVGERVSAALAADPVVVELADRAALEAVPAVDGVVAVGLVVDLEVGAQADRVGAQADQVEAQADQVEAQAAEVQVAEEVRLAVEAQEPSLVNG
jgi:hypothetical protein